MTQFHKRLRDLRVAKRLTQAELAKSVNMSPSVIGMYEQNSRNPSVENLEILADFFNVDLDYLLGRSNMTTRILDEQQLAKLELNESKNIYGNHQANLDYFADKPEILELYKDIYESESLQLLFDTARDLSPENLEAVLKIIERLKED